MAFGALPLLVSLVSRLLVSRAVALLAAQRATIERDQQSVSRAREVELQAAQQELACAGREQRVTHQQRLLELARQQGELEEQLSLAHAERDRNAGEVARATLTREQLGAAQVSSREPPGPLVAFSDDP